MNDYYLLDAGGREPLFLDFRQISSKMARTIERFLLCWFDLRDKKGGGGKEEHVALYKAFYFHRYSYPRITGRSGHG